MVKYGEILRLTALGVSRRNVACPCKQALDRLVPVFLHALSLLSLSFSKKGVPGCGDSEKSPVTPGVGFFTSYKSLKGSPLKQRGTTSASFTVEMKRRGQDVSQSVGRSSMG